MHVKQDSQLQEGQKLQLLENKSIRKTSSHKKDGESKLFQTLHDKLHDLYSSTTVFKIKAVLLPPRRCQRAKEIQLLIILHLSTRQG